MNFFLSNFSEKAKFVCHSELSLYFTMNLWQHFASVMIHHVLCLSKHSRLKTHCSLLIGIGILKLSGPSAFAKERIRCLWQKDGYVLRMIWSLHRKLQLHRKLSFLFGIRFGFKNYYQLCKHSNRSNKDVKFHTGDL